MPGTTSEYGCSLTGACSAAFHAVFAPTRAQCSASGRMKQLFICSTNLCHGSVGVASSEQCLPQTTQCKTLFRFAQKSSCPFGKLRDFQRACARADQGFMMKGSLGKCKRGRLLFCLERKKPNLVQVLSSPIPQPYCISTKDWC